MVAHARGKVRRGMALPIFDTSAFVALLILGAGWAWSRPALFSAIPYTMILLVGLLHVDMSVHLMVCHVCSMKCRPIRSVCTLFFCFFLRADTIYGAVLSSCMLALFVRRTISLKYFHDALGSQRFSTVGGVERWGFLHVVHPLACVFLRVVYSTERLFAFLVEFFVHKRGGMFFGRVIHENDPLWGVWLKHLCLYSRSPTQSTVQYSAVQESIHIALIVFTFFLVIFSSFFSFCFCDGKSHANGLLSCCAFLIVAR